MPSFRRFETVNSRKGIAGQSGSQLVAALCEVFGANRTGKSGLVTIGAA